MQILNQEIEHADHNTLRREFLTLLWQKEYIRSRLTNRVRPLPLELRNRVDENLNRINGLMSICDDKFVEMRDLDFWEHELVSVDISFYLEKVKTYIDESKDICGIKITPY